MKDINFIEPLPAKKQKEIALWFCITLFLSVFSCVIFGFVSIKQIKTLYALTQEQKQCTKQLTDLKPTVETVTQAQEKQKQLAGKCAALSEIKQTISNFAQQLQEIATSIPDTIYLKELHYNNNKVAIVGYGQTAASITQWLKTMQQSPLSKTMHLTLLQSHKNRQEDPFEFYFKMQQ